jgi:selenocysteine-specific elongation factor
VHGKPQPEAFAGQRAAVNLTGVDVADVTRGETLSTAGAVVTTRRIDVQIELLTTARAVRHGSRIRFHQGTRELQARVAVAGPEIAPGSTAFARLHLEAPAALVRRDRFILRTYSPPATIGGGTVLDPLPPRRGVRTAAAAARFERLSAGDREAVLEMVEEAGLKGLPIAQLPARAGIAWDDRENVAATLADVVILGDSLFPAKPLQAMHARVVAAVKEHHSRHPLEEGIPREEVRGKLFPGASGAAFERVVSDLVNAGQVVARDRIALRGHSLALTDQEAQVRDAMIVAFERVISDLVNAGQVVARDRIALRGHSLALTDQEAQVRDAMIVAFERAGLAPPDASELIGHVGSTKDVVERIAGLLVRQKVLVRVGDLLFHESALKTLKDQIRALKREQGVERIDVGIFKDRYQITRKYAIPLLEFLDRERVTRRVGDARQIL